MATIISLPQASKWAKQDNLPPIRQRNRASRTREYLTPNEVERMIVAARHADGRLAERDALSIMMAYRHGLRASELIALRWEQIDLKAGLLHVVRLKRGSPSTHPLRGPELRALRAWKRAQGDATPYVFTSLRGGPMTRRTVHYVVAPSRQGGRYGLSGPPPHAAPRHRLLPCERRPRHARDSALPRPQKHSAYRALYRTGGRSVQRLLEGLVPIISPYLPKTFPGDFQALIFQHELECAKCAPVVS